MSCEISELHLNKALYIFPCSSVGKESACNAGDPGLIPGSGRSPGEGNGNPLQYSCMENPMNRGPWQATVHGVARVRHDLVTKRQEPTSWNDTPTPILQLGASSPVAPPAPREELLPSQQAYLS